MTTFTVKFFARLKEETGTDQLQVALADVSALSDLKEFLIEQQPEWQHFLQANLLTALNQNMVTGDAVLKAGDEVALFPPVTGG